MATLTVGIGDCKVSGNGCDMLVTHALGSCIAVMIYDPVARVGGLLHFMLPESSLDAEKASARPFVFADTGIPLLFHQAYRLGAKKHRLRVYVAGGAQMLESNESFQIGKRNQLATRRILANAEVPIHREEVGGATARTVRLEVLSGKMQLHVAGEER